MTRPQKESDMKREHRVTIRLTDTEFSIIENMAEQADMTISEYMRKQIMEGQVNTKFEIVADVKEIKKLIGEFEKAMNKLGQRLEATIAKFDERITKLEEKQEKDIKDVQKELSSIKGDFATTFVLREDFFRSMNGVEDKMRTMDNKLDKLLLK